jgi:hypothetical protein
MNDSEKIDTPAGEVLSRRKEKAEHGTEQDNRP